MAIKIQLEELIIPVTIGELKFEVDTSDTSIKTLRKKAFQMEAKIKEIEKIAETSEEEAEKEVELYLQDSFDALLGEGAFEKIYKQTPALKSLAKYFIKLIEGLEKEINN